MAVLVSMMRRVLGRGRRDFLFCVRRLRDNYFSTYATNLPLHSNTLLSLFGRPSIESLEQLAPCLSPLTEQYLAHRWNLLGMGWRSHDRSGEERSLSKGNRKEAARIKSLLGQGYQPVDWHQDIRSGYRWSPDCWYKDIQFGQVPGVDIKVPWELSRMQHLPHLAYAYALAQSNHPGFEMPQVYLEEFCQEIIDFLASNPPRFGVNWHCTMDVGIRIANWLVAYDLFRSLGAKFSLEFDQLLLRATYEHARHIVNNLEYSSVYRANHYLANIAGLLFAVAYLPRSPETDAWLAFSHQELVSEVNYQFKPDGSNFEASTMYHRLSAEMVIYATALLLGLPDEKQLALKQYDPSRVKRLLPPSTKENSGLFPNWYWQRLESMISFSSDLMDEKGHLPQIGDQDNGRFFKLSPSLQPGTLEEDCLDHRHLLSAASGFTGNASGLEGELIRALVRRAKMLPPISVKESGARYAYYHDFGVVSYSLEAAQLVIRCGDIGQTGGHAHNDALSIEFSVSGSPFIVDPGTGCYTAEPELRNRLRSTASHNLYAPKDWEHHVCHSAFCLLRGGDARILKASPEAFEGEFVSPTVVLRRKMSLIGNCIDVEDEVLGGGSPVLSFFLHPDITVETTPDGFILRCDEKWARLTIQARDTHIEEGLYSPSYGIVEKTRVIRAVEPLGRVTWRLEWKR